MNRELALKIVLAMVGLLFSSIHIYYDNGSGLLTPETISNAEGHNIPAI